MTDPRLSKRDIEDALGLEPPRARVLIVSGPHAGEVHPIHKLGEQAPDHMQLPVMATDALGAHAPLYFSSDCEAFLDALGRTAETYRIEKVMVADDDRVWFVGQAEDDKRHPATALIEFAWLELAARAL